MIVGRSGGFGTRKYLLATSHAESVCAIPLFITFMFLLPLNFLNNVNLDMYYLFCAVK